MEWNDLKIFLAAVRAGSYTAAGRQLGINRTTVGRRIDALEKSLNVELFHYRTDTPVPTASGLHVLKAATAMEEAVHALEASLKDQHGQFPTVRLASSAGIAIEFMPDLAEFQRTHPHIAIEILSEPDPVDAVTHRRADLALAVLRQPPKRLEGTEVGHLDQTLYGAKQRSSDRALGWGHEIDHAIPAQWTSTNLSGPAAEAVGQPSFNNWSELKQAVIAGIGTASLWCFAADRDDRLERLADPDPKQSYPLWLLRRANIPAGPSLTQLMAFLGDRINSRLRDPNN